jgi:lipopolysaccharide export system protein LptA
MRAFTYFHFRIGRQYSLPRNYPCLLALLTMLTCNLPAFAEKADRDKPVNIESDRMTADDGKKLSIFEGRAILTQGTLIIRADRITVQQDSEGFQYGVATGNLATFRQKREGFDEYVDGEAERIEYNGKADKVQFFTRARLRRDGGDDVRGNYISYDAKTEFFSANSTKDSAPQSRDGRVRAVIMPKKTETDEPTPASGGAINSPAAKPTARPAAKPAAGAAPLQLRGDGQIATPRQD